MTPVPARAATNRLGVWLTLSAEAMFFIGIFGVVLVLRSGEPAVTATSSFRGGALLIACALSAAASGPLYRRERVRERVTLNGGTVSSAPNHPHPDPLPAGERTRSLARLAWLIVVLSATLYLIGSRAALHWPADPSPLRWAGVVLDWVLVLHVFVSLLGTVHLLWYPRPSAVPLLWGFAAAAWIATRLLL